MTKLIPLILILALSGCADRLATWVAYEGDLAARGRAYVDERHRVRQEIRRRCEGLLWAEIDRLQAEGREDEARTILALNYPGLLTVSAVRAYRDGDVTSFDVPFGCRVQWGRLCTRTVWIAAAIHSLTFMRDRLGHADAVAVIKTIIVCLVLNFPALVSD